MEAVLYNAVHDRLGVLGWIADVQCRLCEYKGGDSLHDGKDVVRVEEQRMDELEERLGAQSIVSGGTRSFGSSPVSFEAKALI